MRLTHNACQLASIQFAPKNSHAEYGKCVATVPLFSQTFNKEFSDVLCELLKLRIVAIQDCEDGKRSVCKKWAKKIVNCYIMLTELRKALAGGRALDEAKAPS